MTGPRPGRRVPADPGKITARRTEVGLSQVQLARAAGCTPGMVSRIEAGKSGVSYDMLSRIAQALWVQDPVSLYQDGRDE